MYSIMFEVARNGRVSPQTADHAAILQGADVECAGRVPTPTRSDGPRLAVAADAHGGGGQARIEMWGGEAMGAREPNGIAEHGCCRAGIVVPEGSAKYS